MPEHEAEKDLRPKNANLLAVLKPYSKMVGFLVLFAFISNALTLLIPEISARGIDGFVSHHYVLKTLVIEFLAASIGTFIFTYLQSIIQTYASERVGLDLRTQLSDKISRQSYLFIQRSNPSKLLTNLTSDIDSVKMFVAQAVVSILSSIFIILGASVLLILINWKLALAVLLIIPVIGGTFFIILSKVRVLFKRSREVIDWLNRVINESILGAALIRVLNSHQPESEKFVAANSEAKNLGMSILKLFATMIPIITFVSNLAVLTVLLLGGRFVIGGTMSIGNFAAFNSYIVILIFPILIIGFMSNVIAQAQASYQRVFEVLTAPETAEIGTITTPLSGAIEVQNVTMSYGEKPALKNVSLEIKPRTKTAVIGPTAAGKTQLLYLLIGLIKPNAGVIAYDNQPIEQYESESLHRQIGFVFQDSIIFNLSLRENIAFSDTVTDESLEKAIETAELKDFIGTLPDGLNTIVSERGSSLSGGQKQRVMLARALALNPKILFLDDFTARVDANTELRILENISKNYPDLTLLSVTQKIASVERYDQIILLMEGEILGRGSHEELMRTTPEYVQIFNSQKSTSSYELHPE